MTLQRHLLRAAPPVASIALAIGWLTWLSCQRSITNDRCDYFARRLREIAKEREATECRHPYGPSH